MLSTRVVIIVVLLLFPSTPQAYQADYWLDGRFIIEASNSGTGKKTLEVWDVKLLRGIVDKKDDFIDFNLVRVSLLPLDDGRFTIKDIYTHEYSLDTDNVTFLEGGEFFFEFGLVTKIRVKVVFNEDGSLQDITGSLVDRVFPDNVTAFKLFRDNARLNIVEENKFSGKTYFYEKRSEKRK